MHTFIYTCICTRTAKGMDKSCPSAVKAHSLSSDGLKARATTSFLLNYIWLHKGKIWSKN
jgi:hypothetical protein